MIILPFSLFFIGLSLSILVVYLFPSKPAFKIFPAVFFTVFILGSVIFYYIFGAANQKPLQDIGANQQRSSNMIVSLNYGV